MCVCEGYPIGCIGYTVGLGVETQECSGMENSIGMGVGSNLGGTDYIGLKLDCSAYSGSWCIYMYGQSVSLYQVQWGLVAKT